MRFPVTFRLAGAVPFPVALVSFIAVTRTMPSSIPQDFVREETAVRSHLEKLNNPSTDALHPVITFLCPTCQSTMLLTTFFIITLFPPGTNDQTSLIIASLPPITTSIVERLALERNGKISMRVQSAVECSSRKHLGVLLSPIQP